MKTGNQPAPKRARSLRLALIMLCGQAVALTAASEAQIHWKSGADGVAEKMSRQAVGAAIAELAARPGERHVVVQFEAPINSGQRQKLKEAGVSLLAYVGDNAYFAALDPAVDANLAAQLTSFSSVQAVKRDWKLHNVFLTGELPYWAIVDGPQKAPGAEQRNAGVDDEEARKVDHVVGVYVVFHQDVSIEAAGANTIAAFGGVVRDRVRSVNALVVEIPMSRIRALGGDDSVQWIEPALPTFDVNNDSNRAITGANVVQAAPYNLDGSGINVLVYDAGTALATHVDFGGRVSVRDSSGTVNHSTHVAGTIGGSGAASGGLRRGMAPGVHIDAFGFQYDGSGTFLYNNPGDLEDDYDQAINTFHDVISSNSIGTNTAANGFPCAIEGDYGVTDALIDAIVCGSLGAPFRIVWANGNERGNGRCGTAYHTTAPPSVAKNSISIGALNSNNDSVTTFTSWGPTDDGRLKPDVSGPGCEQGGDAGVTSCSSTSTTAYASLCGTSMATPTIAGLSALLMQDFRANHPSSPDFRGSTLKAILAHTAVDLVTPGPDYQTGYGSVRIQAAVDFERSNNFIEAQVAQGASYSTLVVVDPADTQIKITLAWDDPAAAPNSAINLINDLDLVVTDPLGGRHFPWTLDPANPANAAVRTVEDHVNNSEQVFVATPMAGVWRVDVRGTNVPQGPQTFSLAASPLLVNCSPMGIARFDAQSYRCSDTAVIRVVDCDLNTDNNIVETVNVLVTSSSEPGGEILTLTETGAPTAAFQNSIALSTTNAPGVLQVSDGDTITVTYLDANDGAGHTNVSVQANALVDCTPPVASDIQAINVLPRSATITFQTNEPARATVLYGTSCGSLSQSAPGNGLNVMHSITLTGLSTSTPYFFSVQVQDAAGNMSTFDNSSVCFTFQTPVVPDFYTELFDSSSNDLGNRTMLFTPNGSISFYAACSNPTLTLPTDPTGGTGITLTDDANAQITLTGGAQVRLYGVPYSSFWVGANGYITFNSGDGTYLESLTAHFNQPRISGLFDDLDAAQAGTVSWKQLSDRAVVTWLGVTEHNNANSNTFQIEMYFDGRIRISYLALAASDGLAGLSKGLGVDPDFSETDLSALTSCGPMPPAASDQSVGAPANASIAITLVAGDDGLPAPPALLSYVIQTLPTHGHLNGPGNVLIGAAPFTLPGGANSVTYVPNFNYIGSDSFTFKANDAGTPPSGGDSNTGTVSIMVGVPSLVYTYDLESNPGWSVQGGWAWGSPLGSGSHLLDPSSGFTGTKVYGYNLSGDYPNDLAVTNYLTTTAINCTSLTQVTLKFRRWLGVEQSAYDHVNIQASSDNTNWTTVWTHTSASAISEGAWSLQSYDISAIADHKPTVYIRWGLGTTDGSVTYPGWNIDDVQIFAVQPLPGLAADLNADGAVNALDLALLLGGWGRCNPPCPGDLNGDGAINALDLAILLGSWH